MTDNLISFSYNVLIANLHEMYSFLNKEIEKGYTRKTIIENYSKILTTMLPISPHFASECMEINNFKFKNEWPTYNKELSKNEKINLVVQINGKKRSILNVDRDLEKSTLMDIINNDRNIYKYLTNKKQKKIIFIKNKIINIII